MSPTGSVARTIAEDARTGTTSIRFPLCSAVEHAGDEDRLCSDIAPVDISNLTLPDHRHRLKTCQRSPRRSETAEAKSRSDQSLDAPVILLNDVVEIFALPHASSAPEFSGSLHLCRRPRVGGVFVNRDGARIHDMRLRKRLAEEPLGRDRIPPRRQKEIDRLPAP